MAYVYAWTTAGPIITDLVRDGAEEIRDGVKAALQERIQSVIASISNDPWQFKNIQTATHNTYDLGTTAARFKAGYINALSVNVAQTPSAGNVLLPNLGTVQARNAADTLNLNMLSMNGSNVLQLYNGAATLTSAGVLTTTTFVGALTGNASTATILQTARTINGVSFNGSANITITSTSTGVLTFGTHLTSGAASYDGSANVTITSDATSANTVSTLVARDGSGNFAAGTITATLTGNVTGNLTGNVTGNVTGNLTGNVTGGTIAGTSVTFTTKTTSSTTANGVSFVATGAEFYANTTQGASIGGYGTTSDVSFLNRSGSVILSITATTNDVAFTTRMKSATTANGNTLAATGSEYFANTTYGASLGGYGTTNDVTLFNRSGVAVFGILANTSTVSAASDFIMQTTKKFYLDGGGDTYLQEDAANRLAFTAGGVIGFYVQSTKVIIPSGNFLYIDGGSDTYLYEVAANVIRMVAGASNVADWRSTASDIYSTLSLLPTKQLYLDGGGDTYIYEQSANLIGMVAGGVTMLNLSSSGATVSGSLIIPAAQKFYVDGGSDTYIYEQAANRMDFVAGAATQLSIRAATGYSEFSTSLAITSTKIFYLDGGGDTYMLESSANVIQFFAGGVNTVSINNTSLNLISIPSAAGTTLVQQGSGNVATLVSSIRYKKNVRAMEYSAAAAAIFQSRPVVYNSTCSGDDTTLDYPGFIAEEMDEVDPLYVLYRKGVPESFMYDRFVVPLVLVVQNLEQRLSAVERQLLS